MFVSVICPVYNESKYISDFLDSLNAQTFPVNQLEILMVDGLSNDGTRDTINNFKERIPCIEIVDNPERFVSQALNAGIRKAKGNIIIRMDIHALYPSNYIENLIYNLEHLNADNVGGKCITLPGDQTTIATAISKSISCVFGIGNSYFRLDPKNTMSVDTVPFGCFRRELFTKIGYFDTDLIRNQDDEFNARIIKNGGKIFLVPSIEIKYFARSSLKKLSKMYYQYGLFKPMVVKKTGSVVTLRQLVPAIFLLYLISVFIGLLFGGIYFSYWIIPLFIYIGLSFFFSIKYTIECKKPALLYIMPVVFLVLHISYGFGYLSGTFKLIFNHSDKTKIGNNR